MEAPISHL